MSSEVLIGKEATNPEPCEKIIAEIDGETVEAPYYDASGEKSVLDALVEAGHNPPFSCMSGNCMACIAKIEEGTIYQEDEGVLSEDNIADGEFLSCQAKPKSTVVKFKYLSEI